MHNNESIQSLDQSRVLKISARDVYSAVIALLPVIMIWNVPVINIGLSTLLLGLTVPYALLRYLKGKKLMSFLPVLLMLIYFFIRAWGSTLDQFVLLIIMIHVYGALQGSLDGRVIRKVLETVAMLGTAGVLFQTVYYYATGEQMFLLIPELILEDNRHYFEVAVGSLYRPAAFFLEPSHYVEYCCLGLLSVLFPADGEKAKLGKAVWIVMGCLLTTSSMGIVLCIGIFGWYVLFVRQQAGAKVLSLIGWAMLAVAVFILLMQFSFFSLAVQRIFGVVDGYNAIWGRTLFWKVYITPLSGMDALFGMGRLEMPEDYMTGLMTIIYSYGYVGVAVMLCAYIYMFVKSKNWVARCICVLYCGLMCIADLSGFISIIFWLCIVIASAGEISKKQPRPEGL